MRNVDYQIAEKVKNKETGSVGNTSVKYLAFIVTSEVFLHGNKIASFHHDTGILHVNFCGYISNVTKSRINALCDVLGFNTSFSVVKGQLVRKVDGVVVETYKHDPRTITI